MRATELGVVTYYRFLYSHIQFNRNGQQLYRTIEYRYMYYEIIYDSRTDVRRLIVVYAWPPLGIAA